jgi:hypothetical protein
MQASRPRSVRPTSTARILRGHAACEAAQRTPTPPAPPTARLSRRLLARTAARESAPPIIPPALPRARSAYNSGSAKQRRTNQAMSPRTGAGSPRESSRRPRCFTLPRIVAVARQPARQPPRTNQSQPGPTRRGQATPPAPLKCVGVPPSKCSARYEAGGFVTHM